MPLTYRPKSGGEKLIPSKQVAASAWANVRVVLHNPPESCVSSRGKFQPFPRPPSPATSRAGLSHCSASILKGNKQDREPCSFMGYAGSQGTNFRLDNQLQFRTIISPKDAKGT